MFFLFWFSFYFVAFWAVFAKEKHRLSFSVYVCVSVSVYLCRTTSTKTTSAYIFFLFSFVIIIIIIVIYRNNGKHTVIILIPKRVGCLKEWLHSDIYVVGYFSSLLLLLLHIHLTQWCVVVNGTVYEICFFWQVVFDFTLFFSNSVVNRLLILRLFKYILFVGILVNIENMKYLN